MNRISRSLLSLSLLLSFYATQSHPYWPDANEFGHLLRKDVEYGCQGLAQYNIQQSSYSPAYQREMKATYRIGETISIITPYDDRGAFCRWQFLFNGRLADYQEGIRKLEQSGLVNFVGYYVDERFCVDIWSTDFPCDAVNQMTMNFIAQRPGKIIFYMKNKEYPNYGTHGCSCKPTVTKFEIEIKDHYAPYFLQ